jgi:hypothetical protein
LGQEGTEDLQKMIISAERVKERVVEVTGNLSLRVLLPTMEE